MCNVQSPDVSSIKHLLGMNQNADRDLNAFVAKSEQTRAALLRVQFLLPLAGKYFIINYHGL